MTNEELKKKIVDTMHPILKGTRVSCNEENACGHCLFPCEVDRIVDRLADALIAAGIGDVKRHRVFVSKDGKEVKQLYNGEEVEQIVKEREEYKHRAEVAERALKEFAGYVGCERCPYGYQCELPCVDSSNDYRACFETYVKQAEKELAEEEKE